MKSSSSLPRSVFSLLNVLGETVPLWRGQRISVGRDWGGGRTASQSYSLPSLSRYLCPVTKFSYLCTYDFYSPMHNVLVGCISIRASGRGLALEIESFWAL